MGFDEMWHFIGSKKASLGSQSYWPWYAENCDAWVLGNCNTAAFRWLY
jgi:IS1 family transposase